MNTILRISPGGVNRRASRACHSACLPDPKITMFSLLIRDVGHRTNSVITARDVRKAVTSAALNRPSSFPSGEKILITPLMLPLGTAVTVLMLVLAVSETGMNRDRLPCLVVNVLRRGWWMSLSDAGTVDSEESVERVVESALRKSWPCSGVNWRRRRKRSGSGSRCMVR